MEKKIKAIIFDFDGVIVDSFHEIHEIYQLACKEFGKNCPTDIEEFRLLYGRHSRDARKNLDIPDTHVERLFEIAKEELPKKHSKLYDGIKELLSDLSQEYTLALVSANFVENLEQKVQMFGLQGVFDFVWGRTDCTGKFSKVPIMHDFMQKNNLLAEEVISIGDRWVDYKTAKSASIEKIIIVNYWWEKSRKDTLGEGVLEVDAPQKLQSAIKYFEQN